MTLPSRLFARLGRRGAALGLCLGLLAAPPVLAQAVVEPVSNTAATAAPSGAEYTEYYAPFRPRNQFLVGGLVAWTGILAGGIALAERRRVLGLGLGGGVVVLGVALMLGLVGV